MKTALLVAVALLLAGCSSSSPGKAPAADDGLAEFEDFDIPEGVLVLKGIVVSEAIVPLEGANVTMDGVQSQATTDMGAFVFVDVEEGVHVLTVSKPGYHNATTTATVTGEDDPLVRVLLQSDPGTLPYHQVYHVSGMLQCGMGLPTGGSYSTCQTPNGVVDITCNTSGGAVCLPYVMSHRGILEIDIGLTGIPHFAQAEAVWDPTSPNSQRLTWASYARPPGTLEFNNQTSFTGESVLLMPWNQTKLQEARMGAEQIFVFQVFPEFGGVGNVVLQQGVDLYLTVFYNYQPPEGWSLAADGEPQPP